MSDTIYAVVGDEDKVVAVTLRGDPTAEHRQGVPINLAGESIVCHMQERSSGVVQTITGLVGDAEGNVSTPFATENLLEGDWWLEWQVVGGLTYPEAAGRRPLMKIRPEVA